MKIASVKLYAFTLPLCQPLNIGRQTIGHRQGILVALTDEDGHNGYGEAAPLPGFQRETIADCRRQLLEFLPTIKGEVVPAPVLDLNGTLASFLPEPLQLHSAVRFAMESALLNLAAAAKGRLLAKALNENHRPLLRVNGLLLEGTGNMVEQAKAMIAQQYYTIKMKIGRAAPEKERARVLDVLQQLPAGIKLRLDANRAWSLAEALLFSQGLPVQRIEYIEEPLREFKKLDAFYRRTHLPYALDETLMAMESAEIVPAAGLAAIVVKPAFLGSLEKSKQLISLAAKVGAQAVISDAFGSGVALSLLSALAAAFAPGDSAMGFDTYRWLKKDILRKRLKINSANIRVEDWGRQAQQIHLDRLERLL